MFIVQVRKIDSTIHYLDEELRLTTSENNAFIYKSSSWAIAAKKYCESQWNYDCKILAV
jgi:hypothetical protein